MKFNVNQYLKNVLAISIIFLIHSCDYIACSDKKLSSLDENFLFEMNKKYSDFEIYPDKCFPQGYFNVSIKDDKEIDTLTLNKILDQSLQRKTLPNQIQVFGSNNNFKFILYKARDKYLILFPNDL